LFEDGKFVNKKTGCINTQPVRTALRIQNIFYESILLLGGGLESNETRSITIEMKKMV
jgi:hypothetical protein